MNLNSSVSMLSGVGRTRAEQLSKIGINSAVATGATTVAVIHPPRSYR